MTSADENGLLPDGWSQTTIANVTNDVASCDPRRRPDQAFSYVDISGIDNKRLAIAQTKNLLGSEAPSRARRPLKTGDIVFSNVRTYLRNIARVDGVPDPAVASTGFTVLRPNEAAVSDYLFRYVSSYEFLQLITPRQTGTHYPATSDGVVREQVIPLPPLAEQRRIATRLDEIETRRAAAAVHLQAADAIVERYRNAVLAAACAGRLTEDWREENMPTPSVEILERKREADRKRLGRKHVEPVLPEPDSLPALPDQWCWALLPELGKLGRGRSKHRPRNDPSLYGAEYPFIQTGDIARSGGRVTSHTQSYNDRGLAQSRLWPTGTVCITIAANIADSALLSHPACFPDSVVGLIADRSVALPEYAELFIRTARRDLAAFAPATAQANINLAILSNVAVALPSIAEQYEIVRRVEATLPAADRLRTQIDRTAATLDRVSKASLAKAFRGELVPTEAALAEEEARDYESAGELLARVATAPSSSPTRAALAGTSSPHDGGGGGGH
ncbi:MAG: restriction endonuclease subunit S [Thermoleophilaceae bacterium]